MAKCFAPNCPLSTAVTWVPSNCTMFVTAPQPLKEFLYRIHRLWNAARELYPSRSTEQVLYDYFYARDTAALPIVDPDGPANWYNPIYYDAATGRTSTDRIRERVYLSVQAGSLLKVFSILGRVAPRFGGGIVWMKRSTVASAANRPDTIVVYTTGPGATQAVVGVLRNLLHVTQTGRSAPAAGAARARRGAPAARATTSTSSTSSSTATTTATSSGSATALDADDFKQDIGVPGTISSGLPGISTGPEPTTRDSMGTVLCRAIGEGVDFVSRHSPGGVGALSAQQFACVALGFMHRQQVNVKSAWFPSPRR